MNKPFEPRVNFVMIPNAFMTLYSRLPDFKADAAMLWAYLSMRYNSDVGYAYPNTWDIAIALNVSESKVTMLKKILLKYDLVEVSRHSAYSNGIYVPKAPITDEVMFYAKYPEAFEYYETRKGQVDDRRRSAKERKKAYVERVKGKRESDVYVTDEGAEIPIDKLF